MLEDVKDCTSGAAGTCMTLYTKLSQKAEGVNATVNVGQLCTAYKSNVNGFWDFLQGFPTVKAGFDSVVTFFPACAAGGSATTAASDTTSTAAPDMTHTRSEF